MSESLPRFLPHCAVSSWYCWLGLEEGSFPPKTHMDTPKRWFGKGIPPLTKMTMFGIYVGFPGCSVSNVFFCFRVVFNVFFLPEALELHIDHLAASSQVFCCRIWRKKARFCPVWFLQKSLVWMPSLKKDLFGVKDDLCCWELWQTCQIIFTIGGGFTCVCIWFSPLQNGLKSPTSSAIHAKL